MELTGFRECGSPPGVPNLAIREGETDVARRLRQGRVRFTRVENWLFCIETKTDQKVIFLARPIPFILTNQTSFIFETFSKQTAALNLWLSKLEAAAEEILERELIDIAAVIAEATSKIIEELTFTIQTITEQTQAVITDVTAPIAKNVNEAIGILIEVTQEIDDLAEETFSIAERVIEEIESGIKAPIIEGFAIAGQFVANTISDLRESLQANLLITNQLLFEITREIDGVVRGVFTVAASLEKELSALTEGLPAGFDEVFRNIGNELLGNAAGIIDGLIDILLDRVVIKIKELSAEFDVPTQDTLDSIFSGIQTDLGINPFIKEITKSVPPKSLSVVSVGLAVALPFFFNQLFGSATQPEQQLLLQEHSRIVSWNLPPVEVLVAAKRRGFITDEQFIEGAGGLGFAGQERDIFERTDKLQLDSGTAIQIWLRNFITDEQLTERLNSLGFESIDQDLIKKNAEILPSVQDLIRFMVRDVFSSEVTAKFQQFQDFPDKFEDEGKKLGLSKELALNFWAAHWELPPIRLAFEMLHRGIIDEETLDILLKAKDIMPFWKEPIKKVAFRVFTRVDIRRMHKMGVLSDDDVLKAHKELGYDDEKAKLLSEFVIRLTSPEATILFTNPVETPQQQIEQFLKRGIISGDEAKELLIIMGFADEDSDLIIRSVQLFSELERRDEKIKSTIELAVSGAIDVEEAEAGLFKLNFETEEVRRTIDKITDERKKRNKIPELNVLNSMLLHKIISKEEFINALENTGFSNEWAEKLFNISGK